MWGELAHSFQNADEYMIAIIALGFLSTIIFFERLIMLRFVYDMNFHKFLSGLRKMIIAEDIDRAITLCKNARHTSLPLIARKALEASETDPTTIKGVIEEETIDFLPKLEKRLSVMPIFPMLIMLVGVLGTIDSLWHAFHSVDVLDTAKKQATLAQGIANALNPTAISLLFAMLLLAGNQFLKAIAVHVTERIHHGVSVISNLLVPTEVASYVPVAAVAGAPAAAAVEDTGSAESTESEDESYVTESADEGDAADDSFDDVSVEDIKDEEEII